MDSLFDDLGQRAVSLAAKGRLTLVVVLLALVGLGLAVGGIFVHSAAALQVTMGSLGGLLFFFAGYMFWFAGLNADLREKLNFRGQLSLGRRRVFVVVLALLWILVLWAVGSRLGSSLLGAFNVAVLLTLWRLFTATGQERAALDEQLEMIWVERQLARSTKRSWWRRMGVGSSTVIEQEIIQEVPPTRPVPVPVPVSEELIEYAEEDFPDTSEMWEEALVETSDDTSFEIIEEKEQWDNVEPTKPEKGPFSN